MTAEPSPASDGRCLLTLVNTIVRRQEELSGCKRVRRRRKRGSVDGGMPIAKNIAACRTAWAWLAVILLLGRLSQCESFICKEYGSRIRASMHSRFCPSFGVSSHGAHHPYRTGEPTRMTMLDRNGAQQHNGEHNDNTIPRHVAFICDGNSRWAQSRGLPASAGHLAGADRLVDCLNTLKRTGVECCTFYGFSTENWKRSPEEIRDILYVTEQTARKFYQKAIEEHMRVKILGDLKDPRIPDGLKDILQKLERDTADLPSILTVCIAINYGGRQDILNASIKMAKALSSGELCADEVTEDDFSSLLFTSGIPDPDLMIRTGGEKRLSNFLLWNCAYSELYFSQDLWPDFDEASILEALEWYSSRSRRFGGRTNSAKAAAVP